jgi:hypothetical protein
MRGTVLYGPGDIRFEDRETPKVIEPSDAVIRMAATCGNPEVGPAVEAPNAGQHRPGHHNPSVMAAFSTRDRGAA